jgi:hypothetical protein
MFQNHRMDVRSPSSLCGKRASQLFAQVDAAADEEFFAALSFFDDVQLPLSSDDELGHWLSPCASINTPTRPFLFPCVVSIPVALPSPIAFPRARLGQDVPASNNLDIQYDLSTRTFSTNNHHDVPKPRSRPAPDTISPCGLRKCVKVDEKELALLNPGLEQIAELLSCDIDSILTEEQCSSPNSTSTGSSSSNSSNNSKQQQQPVAHAGETRLRIGFSSYGRTGLQVQHYGKSGCIIPDGLCGTHEMYDQPWRFEVSHEMQSESSLVLITWTITNMASGAVTCMRETPQQATLREFSGRTICNKVVKMALTSRAKELEASLATLSEGSKRQAVENAVKVLRPKLCTVGLLFFGLLHDSVQKRVE